MNKLKPFILKWEGGFVNDPDDLGGATNRGVTIAVYQDYCKKKGRPEPTIDDLKRLPDEEWTEILKIFFWDRWKANAIRNQSIANILVDWVWTSGVYGISWPQDRLGVKPNGVVGNSTLDAINMYPSQQELFNIIRQIRLDFIDRICFMRPTNEKYRQGWCNRIYDFTFEEESKA